MIARRCCLDAGFGRPLQKKLKELDDEAGIRIV